MNFISKYKSISRLKKNVFSGSILSGVDILVSMISYPIYLKYLGVEKYGLWTVVSVVLSFTQIGQFGISTAITKLVAGNYGNKNIDEITEYTTTSFFILIVPSFIIMSTLLFLKTKLARLIGVTDVFIDDGEQLIFFVGLLSVFSFFVDIIKGVVIGIGRMDITNSVFIFVRIFQIILSVCLLLLGLGVWSLYFGFLFYHVLPFLVFLVLLKYGYRIKIFKPTAFKKQKLKDLINFGGVLTIGTLAHMFVVPFNKVIISKYVGLSEVTYYQIAYQVVIAIRGLFVKGLEAILPRISEIHSKTTGSLKSILSVHRKGMKFVLICVFPVFLAVFVFTNPILKLWLGKNFHIQIATALRVLLIGWFFNILAVPDYFMFMGIGKVNYGVTATCIKSVTNTIIVFTLIFLNIQFTLNKVVIIDSICLIFAVIFLKYKYYQFRKARLFLK